MTFDLNSIIPEGYDAVAYRKPERDELVLDTKLGAVKYIAGEDAPRIILRKNWTPQPGELIANAEVILSNEHPVVGRFIAFEYDGAIVHEGRFVKCWHEYRQLTPEELSTLFPKRGDA